MGCPVGMTGGVYEAGSELQRAVSAHERQAKRNEIVGHRVLAAVVGAGIVLWFAVVASCLSGCAESWVGPVTPVGPVEPVQPVDPVQPAPPRPVQVATYDAVHVILPGWTRAQVEASIGFPAALEARQDDGTLILRWPALGKTGAPRWADVQFDAGGLVIGHVLLPRAEAP